MQKTAQISIIDDIAIAVRSRISNNNNIHLMWCGGYRTSMLSGKASAIDTYAESKDLSYLRWDYAGHGESAGDFFQQNFSSWLEQAYQLYKTNISAPLLLIGSSLGGWISLCLAQKLIKEGRKIAGILLIAPAIDFTTRLLLPSLSEKDQDTLNQQGFILYGNPWNFMMPFTKNFIEDSKKHLLLTKNLQFQCPIHIIHGLKDEIIPFSHIEYCLSHLPRDNVTVTTIADGDHRLSRPEDLSKIIRILDNMVIENAVFS
ncbi:alpha/beta hydrolase [Bartonella sp. DGB1]|uniref:alpha/beta hydrolase n=1 Tax=Bartonella sp. DGB1 TaxID=3239807 RepID=UPI00352698CC